MMFTNWFGQSSNLPQTSSECRRSHTVRMELGQCRFNGLNYRCQCVAGIYTSTTGILDRSAPCASCGHYLSEHDDYSESCSPPTTLQNQPRQPQVPYTQLHREICPRNQTVQTLAQLLTEYRVIHVRGTPASGKTTLSILLFEYLSLTENALLIETWDSKRSASEFLAEKCRAHGYTDMQPNNIRSSSLIFIIDEAQQTYVDPSLWYGLIKSHIGRSAGPRFCLFSVYGSPRTGALDYPIGTTPPVLNFSQRVSLTKSSNPAAPEISLFYDLSEYRDVLKRFCQRPGIEFILSTGLGDYIYSLTNGHPGMVEEVLIYVRNFYRSHLKRRDVSEIALEDVQEVLENDHELFGHLKRAPAGRSLPSREMHHGSIDPGVVMVLLNVLRDGCIQFDRLNENMRCCFRRGWIHTEEDEFGQLKCFFPSNLHARFVEYYFGRDSPNPFPREKYQDLKGFCLKIIQRFSASMLCGTRDGRRIGPSGQRRPPEAAYQDEFYRCYWYEVGTAAGICSEWSGNKKGRIDFHIPEPGWGIEFLRDGDRIPDHLNRFRPNGAYHSWIQLGLLKDWLILDCRHDNPKSTYPNEPKLWRVIFQGNYTRVNVLDCNNKEVVPEFYLANE